VAVCLLLVAVVYAFFICPMHAVGPAKIILFDLIIHYETVLGESFLV
jgi:hypothetical protein